MENATMNPRNYGFLLSEASGNRSRNTVTIASGEGKLSAGTVIGKITASGEYAASPDAVTVGKEGAETAIAVLATGIDATDAAVEAVIIDRDAEVKTSMLIYEATVNDQPKTDAKNAQLDAVGIRVR